LKDSYKEVVQLLLSEEQGLIPLTKDIVF
jgi:hypothetical protein